LFLPVVKQNLKAGWILRTGGNMKTFTEFLKTKGINLEESDWIQGAINPKHKGYCTPMTKPTCTPRRKALAKRFKHGDIHDDNEK
jgi:hypothetical protein